ncbi:hypothetical protein [Desulfosarcina cetonica]|uniref:hypothetical protein n=1 Tax=Desulfosarcina cetonica TaxID=90730 RepID=UPI0012EE2BA2|nr:hypothetical protein [Desulfosarcina cetonica]
MTPATRRRHLASGAPLDLIYGIKPDGTPFTVEDLKKFDEQARKRRKEYGASKKGVRVDQLIAASRTVDIDRSKKEIRSAILYRVFNSNNGMLLHFRVSSGPDSKHTHHQVKIRLDEWDEQLDDSSIKLPRAAKNILDGRISFDCDCGRHQYWYRYVATIGGFAVSPLERAYPKIRNPKLTGACCKHVLKVLATLRGPATRRLIMLELKKEAERIGFGDDRGGVNRYLTRGELETAAKSSAAMRGVDKAQAQKAFRAFLDGKAAFGKKLKEEGVKRKMDELRKAALERDTYKSIAKQEKSRGDREARDKALAQLGEYMAVSIYRDKMTRDAAIKSFANANKMKLDDVKELAENVSHGK